MFYVYKITNLINGKIYIGKTNNVNNRWKRHKLAAIKKYANDYSSLHRAINKYGFDYFNIEIIETFNLEEDSLLAEIKYIELYNSNNKNIGYNLTNGGEGSTGYKHTPEIVEEIRNRRATPEIKIKISEGCRGSKQWNAKFSDSDIITIRQMWDSKVYSQTEIAKIYKVKPNTINQIVLRKRWIHIK